jgi:hypothetical protein
MTPEEARATLQGQFPGFAVDHFARAIEGEWHIFSIDTEREHYRLWVSGDAMGRFEVTPERVARLRAAGQRTPRHKLVVTPGGEADVPITRITGLRG